MNAIRALTDTAEAAAAYEAKQAWMDEYQQIESILVGETPEGELGPLAAKVDEMVRGRTCSCGHAQPGWQFGRCDTCGLSVTPEMWSASYPAKRLPELQGQVVALREALSDLVGANAPPRSPQSVRGRALQNAREVLLHVPGCSGDDTDSKFDGWCSACAEKWKET